MNIKSLATTLALALTFSTSYAGNDVPLRAEDVKPLPAGVDAPAFTVKQPDGSDFAFKPDALEKPALLIFYRGGWCPYCNTQLQSLRNVVPKLLAADHDVLFLSADSPSNLFASLKEPGVDYTLLSDASMATARKFGIAFVVDDETLTRYKKYGIDLEAASGYDHHQLPVPAVYLVDTNGKITFVHTDPDYKKRLAPEKILAAAGL